MSKVRLAKSGGRLDQRIQHRLKIESRAADDLEHVGGGGLLLQRFAQLIEQPRVLDGDDGLVGEGDQKLDLLIAKRPDGSSSESEDTDRRPLRISGTPNIVRNPVARCACGSAYSGSLAASSMCTGARSSNTRPIRPSRPGLNRSFA